MKKIILGLIILILSVVNSYSQAVDTSVFRFVEDKISGYYTAVENKTTWLGKPSGSYKFNLYALNTESSPIDTATWQFYMDGASGKYTYVLNKIAWLGMSANTVKANVVNSATEIGSGTSDFTVDSMWVYLAANTTHDIGVNVLTADSVKFGKGDIVGTIAYLLFSYDGDSWVSIADNQAMFSEDVYIYDDLTVVDTISGKVLNISRNALIDTLNVTTVTTIGKTLDVTGTSTYGINTNKLQVDTLLEGDGENGISTNTTFKPTGDDQCDLGSIPLAWRDVHTNDIFIQDTLTSVTGIFSGNVTCDTVHTQVFILDNATEFIVNVQGSDITATNTDGIEPILDGTYNNGSDLARWKKTYTDSLAVTEMATTKNLTVTNNATITGDISSVDTITANALTINKTATIDSAKINTNLIPTLCLVDTSTQVVAIADSVHAFKFSNVEINNLFTYTAGKDSIVFQEAGTYLIIVSAVADLESEVNHKMELWFRVNGTDVPRSNTIVGLATATTEITCAVNFMYTFAVGDRLKVCYSGNDDTCQWLYTTASAHAPVCPSIILTINKIR